MVVVCGRSHGVAMVVAVMRLVMVAVVQVLVISVFPP